MGRFTDLDHNELAGLAQEFGLGTLSSFRPIAAGTINSNYQIDTSTGRYFLRVNEGKSCEEVAYEFAVVGHLVTGGIATPLPLKVASGLPYALHDGQCVSVFPWQLGNHALAASITSPTCRSIGRTLADLHVAGQGMTELREGRYTFDAIAEAYEDFSDSRDPELAVAIQMLGAELAWLRGRGEERANLPSGLIHADLFPDNVLMQSDRVSALLDFEQACVGAYAYDLAVGINAWCFADEMVPERVIAMLSGYREARRLDGDEVLGLEAELRGSALRFAVTRIRDIHIPDAGGTYVGKDFRRFLMRLETWQHLGHTGVADLAKAASLV